MTSAHPAVMSQRLGIFRMNNIVAPTMSNKAATKPDATKTIASAYVPPGKEAADSLLIRAIEEKPARAMPPFASAPRIDRTAAPIAVPPLGGAGGMGGYPPG
ncbi:hypothetical protein MTY66_04260 [Mycolicibacterium sp. TY66]|nr:hypothetical protein MTY66_04260 [Mycolicibacterium sp. TY66]BCJ83537.1 hypothetical protein MTY81_49100 [Mycolicibacterium sp. TY81]